MDLNRVFLIGRLTNDPEARMTPSGTPVANFRMATNRVFKDKQGQRQEQTEFHTIVAWGRQAEIVREYLKRGGLVFVEGRLQTRSWEGKDGQKHWQTEIISERVQLGPRSAGSQGAPRRAEPPADGSTVAPGTAQESVAKANDIPVIEEDTPMNFDEEPRENVDPKEIPF